MMQRLVRATFLLRGQEWWQKFRQFPEFPIIAVQ